MRSLHARKVTPDGRVCQALRRVVKPGQQGRSKGEVTQAEFQEMQKTRRQVEQLTKTIGDLNKIVVALVRTLQDTEPPFR